MPTSDELLSDYHLTTQHYAKEVARYFVVWGPHAFRRPAEVTRPAVIQDLRASGDLAEAARQTWRGSLAA